MEITDVIGFVQEYKEIFWILGSFSLLLLLFSLVVIPLIVIHIPADYFAREKRFSFFQENVNPVVTIFWLVLKNFVGAVFVLLGLVMLFTPGQGLITLFIGMLFMNFPGKYRLEKRIIRQKNIFGWMNRLRSRFNKPELVYPDI